ncbi:hypothetical protein [Endozoicomonas elysicola]|uniref:Uncharacterized protein n=1 Tax=Endozoicomonas elysicola TaxID=305900 RepID=A0A081K877_9GAMM|nr:hypothetical protein [Endozoicomonas elysicola]KEI70353.1 hypothetical protein GV64_06085 [Endozoicomonas elysicola]
MDKVDQQPAGMNAQGYDVCDHDVCVHMREVRATWKTRMGRSCCVAAAAMGCYLTWGDGVFWTSIGSVLWGALGKTLGERLIGPQKCNHKLAAKME